MIRMQAPAGMSFFSHQGYPIDIDGDGIAVIDDRHQRDLEDHGFVVVTKDGSRPLSAASLPPPSAAQSEQSFVLKDRLGQLGISDPRRIAVSERLGVLPTETLEMLADIADGKIQVLTNADRDAATKIERTVSEVNEQRADAEPDPAEQPESIPAAGRLTDTQIQRMNKAQMIAWLKERDIPAIPPIDNDELRAKVRHANGG